MSLSWWGRRSIWLAVVASGVVAPGARGQSTLPPAPVPAGVPSGAKVDTPAATRDSGNANGSPAAQSPVPTPAAGTPMLTPPPPLMLTPPPPPGAVYDPGPAPVLRPYDPVVDGPHRPGWFMALELAVLQPHVKFGLQGSVPTLDPAVDQAVQVPFTPLDWMVQPRVEIGYRCAEGFGEFLIGYRFASSEGRANYQGWDAYGDGEVRSRFDMNVVDLDYGSHEDTWGPRWDIKWRVGLRLASLFFDSEVTGAALQQSASNQFFGVGPHLGLDLSRRIGTTGLDLFCRTDGSVLFGRAGQTFEQTALNPDDSVTYARNEIHATQTSPVLMVQAGLGWRPSGLRDTRFTVGYQYEYWWNPGNVLPSTADAYMGGVYFRGEIRY